MIYQPILAATFTLINWRLVGKTVDPLGPVVIGLLGIWLLINLLRPKDVGQPAFFLGRLALLLCVYHAILEPTWFSIVERRKSGDLTQVHDGLVQLEIATNYLARGGNPYTLDYFQTKLKDCPYQGLTKVNPALHHFTYLPSLVIFNHVVSSVSRSILGVSDARILLILAYLGSLTTVLTRSISRNKKVNFLIFFGLNPLTLCFLINGRNDIFLFFWILLGVTFLAKQQNILSALALAIAVTSKQPAWLAVPFFLIYWIGNRSKPTLRSCLKPLLVLLLTTLALSLPFILSSSTAFLKSTIFYPLGLGKTAYSVSPHSFGLRRLIFIDQPPSFWKTTFFAVIQLAVLLPLFFYLVRRQKLTNTPQDILVHYGVFLAVFWYFVTYFHDNHILFIIWVFIAIYTFEAKKAGLKTNL
jgi:hypothetical protein